MKTTPNDARTIDPPKGYCPGCGKPLFVAQGTCGLSACENAPGREGVRTMNDYDPAREAEQDARDHEEANETTVECAYCGCQVSGPEVVPPASDGDAWGELAAEHGDDCEWVQTRAHRIDPRDPYYQD